MQSVLTRQWLNAPSKWEQSEQRLLTCAATFSAPFNIKVMSMSRYTACNIQQSLWAIIRNDTPLY